MNLKYIDKFLSSLVEFSIRQKYLVIGSAFLCSALSIWLTVQHARIDTNTENMLSDRLDWRIANDNYKTKFPFFSDTIIVVIEGPTADLTFDAASYFLEEIVKFGIEKKHIFFPESEYFFQKNKFLYLEPTELADLSDTLDQSQAMLGMLAQNPTILGLLNMTDLILAESSNEDSKNLAPLINTLTASIDSFLNGANAPMSWRGLLQNESEVFTSHRVLFTIQPDLDFDELLPGSKLIQHIRGIAASISPKSWPGVNVRLTGAAALGYDELDSVITGAGKAGVLALIGIFIVLSAGLKSVEAVFSILTVVILGLTYTSAFAAIAIGSLNMISIAFSVLYVGLAADFAIHYYFTYIEESSNDHHLKAIERATQHNIAPLSLCAFTTSIGFLAFIPTVYKGVAELGVIAGVGMVIGLLTSFTVLPAMIATFPGAPRTLDQSKVVRKSNFSCAPSPKTSIITLILIFLGGLFVAKQISFDVNPIHLNNPKAESVLTLNDLSSDDIVVVNSINFIAENKEKARGLASELLKLEEVTAVKTFEHFIPNDQEEKLKLIESMMWSLGGDIEIASPINDPFLLEPNIERNLATIKGIVEPTFQLKSFSKTLNTLLKTSQSLDNYEKKRFYNQLNSHIMRHFPAVILHINSGTEAETISTDSLPESLKNRWVTPNGNYRLEITPSEILDTNAKTEKFIKKVRELVGRSATGVPIINLEASQAVIKSFVQAFLFAIVVVTCVIWLSTRNIAQLLVVMTPLIMGFVLTVATMVLLEVPLNFANIIALPLLVGISVDSTLHVLYRYKRSQKKEGDFLRTSTAKAILLSALTTGTSFGGLAFSAHAGTASMGVLLTIGLIVNLICSLILLPLLLQYFINSEDNRV